MKRVIPVSIAALGLASCGSPHTAAEPSPQSSTTAATRTQVATTQSLVTSVATGRHTDAPIDLRRVVLRTTSTDIVATFHTYGRVDRAQMVAPWCGQVGINFMSAHRTVQSSAQLLDSSAALTPTNGVHVEFIGSHTIRLQVARSALGPRFTPTTPWIGFSNGPGCPPMNVAEDALRVVTPTRDP